MLLPGSRVYYLRAAYGSNLMQTGSIWLLRIWKRNELRSVYSAQDRRWCPKRKNRTQRYWPEGQGNLRSRVLLNQSVNLKRPMHPKTAGPSQFYPREIAIATDGESCPPILPDDLRNESTSVSPRKGFATFTFLESLPPDEPGTIVPAPC